MNQTEEAKMIKSLKNLRLKGGGLFSPGKRELRRDGRTVFKYIQTAVERIETNCSSCLLEIEKKYDVLKLQCGKLRSGTRVCKMIKCWNRSLTRYNTSGPFDALPAFLHGMKNLSLAVQCRKCFV